MRALVVALSILGGASCSATADLGPVECQVGSGVTKFIPLADGSAVRIAAGPQGGHHIWGGVISHGLEPKQITARYTHTDPSTGEVLGEVVDQVELSPVSVGSISGAVIPECPTTGFPEDAVAEAGAIPEDLSGWSVGLASTVYVSDDGSGTFPRFAGKTVRMTVELTDAEGRSCRSSRLVLPCF